MSGQIEELITIRTVENKEDLYDKLFFTCNKTNLRYFRAPIVEWHDALDRQFLKHLTIDRLLHKEEKYGLSCLFEFFQTFEGSKCLMKLLMENFLQFDEKNQWRYHPKELPALFLIPASAIFENELEFYKFTKQFVFLVDDAPLTGETIIASYISYPSKEELKHVDGLDVWDKYTKMFNYTLIRIHNVNGVSENDLFRALLHELEHAHNDYALCSEEDSSFFYKSKILDYVIEDKVQEFLKSSKEFLEEFKIQIDGEQKEIKDKVASLIYKLSEFDSKTFVTQVSSFIDDLYFDDVGGAFSYIRKYYKPYSNYKIIYQLLNEKDSSILDYVGFDKSDINEFRKISKNVWHKMSNYIYLACKDSIVPRPNNQHHSIQFYAVNPEEKIWNRISNDEIAEQAHKEMLIECKRNKINENTNRTN